VLQLSSDEIIEQYLSNFDSQNGKMLEIPIRVADWSLLFVYPPGKQPESAGILLLDPKTNELYVRLKCQLRNNDEDLLEVWELLSEDLEQKSKELGGDRVLRSLEASLSHTFQVSDRYKVEMVDPDHTIAKLFEEHVIGGIANGREDLPTKVDSDDLLEARKKLHVSSNVAFEAMVAFKDPKLSDEKLEAIIEKDPVLAAHLVRVANSPLFFYATRHRPVEIRSIEQAVRQLGWNATRRQILSFCLRPLFSPPHLQAVWNHSIEVAQVARTLGERCHYHDPEEALLVGLAHDIGLAVLAGLDDGFQEQYTQLQELGHSSLYAETILCGTTHAIIGADLLSDWNWPADMVEAVRRHHDLNRSSLPLASILHLAEAWVESKEAGYQLSDHAHALSIAGLSPDFLRSLEVEAAPDLMSMRFAA
jgi:HD-like signal output (HDOD) protein